MKTLSFDRAKRTGAIPEEYSDIRDHEALERFIDLHKPSTIIHMAAQPLVLKSYESARETFEVNVMGTVNVLDVAFKKDFVKAVIIVTTDKVYKNDNSGRAFIESDPLEGKDPYSASKVGTEAVVTAWQQIAKISGGPRVVSVRAGNVIGGGDFAANRIIPDLIRGVFTGDVVRIRNPHSTRPWQHVLDPVVGYILTLEKSFSDKCLEKLNFGPLGNELRVFEVAEYFSKVFRDRLKYEFIDSTEATSQQRSLEASQLKLDSRRARELLDWSPKYSQIQAVGSTASWWVKLLVERIEPEQISKDEVQNYLKLL